MKLSIYDPVLTAYALGELDETERAKVERALAESPECRDAVEEIRQTAGLLTQEFSREPMVTLTEPQREAVVSGTPVPTVEEENIVELPSHRWRQWHIAALAACLVVSLGGVMWMTGPKAKSGQLMAKVDVSQPKSATVSDPAKGEGQPAIASTEMQKPAETPPPSGSQIANVGEVQEPAEMNKRLEARYSPVDVGTTRGRSVIKSTAAPLGLAPVSPSVLPPPPKDVFTERYGMSAPTTDRRPMEAANSLRRENGRPQALLEPTPAAAQPLVASKNYAYGGGNGGGARPAATPAPGAPPRQDRYRLAEFGEKELRESEVRQSGRWYKESRVIQSGASYPQYIENAFLPVIEQPLSTFSIDVDTASYANVRRFLRQNQLPPRDAVRIEELINYFSYSYPAPRGDEPFSANVEVAASPWNPRNRLVRIGLKGREIARDKRPASNFVFLIDVSGSMSPADRLPLIKQSLRLLVKRMNGSDRVAIVVYASSSGTVLESTSCEQKEKILEAIERLEAGGSTNGGEGIQRAYGLAQEHFIKGGVNRVILCTDGDFNVGITDQSQLIQLIQDKAKSGVFLSALGVGDDNFKDALMQKMADKGNGNYHYIDSLEEAQKVLVEQMNGTLVTIAKDVKIQIEFNPDVVASYRLIGYEKRVLANADFNDDTKDAGEIGAGHTVTALYEVVPAGAEMRPIVDGLKYQPAPKVQPRAPGNGNKEMLTLKIRYKKPDGDTSRLSDFVVMDQGYTFHRASSDFQFAAAVASFGMVLKDSAYRGTGSFGSILEIAEAAKGSDVEGYRSEFITLVKKAREHERRTSPSFRIE